MLSGAKSDAGDAEVIAEYLRLRAHRLRAATPTPATPRRCAPWSAPATTWSTCASRRPTSSPRCSIRTGPAPRRSSPTSSRRSPGVPDPLPDRRPRRSAPRREADGRVLRKHGYSGRRSGQPSCSPGCAPHPPAPPSATVAEALRDASWRWSPCSRTLNDRCQGPGPLRRRPPRGAPGRQDLHLAATVGSDQRRPDARRVGRLPRSLRRPRRRRRARRCHPRHQGVRQAPRRALPLGLQQAVPRRDHHLRRQQPPRQPLGRQRSTPTPAPRARTTPTPSASSPAPGSASSGAAGSTTTPTTPAATATPTQLATCLRLTQGVSRCLLR